MPRLPPGGGGPGAGRGGPGRGGAAPPAPLGGDKARRRAGAMSSAGGRQPSQSRAIPTRTVTLSDAAQLPADYCTTPGGTLFSTTPGGKSAAPAGASRGARPGQPERRVSRAYLHPSVPSLSPYILYPLSVWWICSACRPFPSAHTRGVGFVIFPGARRVPAGRQLDPGTGGQGAPDGSEHRGLGASALPRPGGRGKAGPRAGDRDTWCFGVPLPSASPGRLPNPCHEFAAGQRDPAAARVFGQHRIIACRAQIRAGRAAARTPQPSPPIFG